jgi:hypothetical protein
LMLLYPPKSAPVEAPSVNVGPISKRLNINPVPEVRTALSI